MRATENIYQESVDSSTRPNLETQYRAAVQIENTEDAEQRSDSDGTSAEVSKIESRAMLGNYLQAAVETRAVDGAEAELNAANGLVPSTQDFRQNDEEFTRYYPQRSPHVLHKELSLIY